MTDKPTRQQIVDALENAKREDGYKVFSPALAANILIRAGLAVEPREEGAYWVKMIPDSGWVVAKYWSDTNEWTWDADDIEPPNVIGPRILPPQE
jgi:hypothetical protein